MDNDPEFIAHLTSEWSKMHGIEFKCIQPGKPTQNAFIKRFNGSLQNYKYSFVESYIYSFEGLRFHKTTAKLGIRVGFQVL